jgi:hypothetical protein
MRRFPSKPRVGRKAQSALKHVGKTGDQSSAIVEHDRAVKHYNDVLAKLEKYDEPGYYEAEAAAKVSELHSEYISKLNDEIAHANQSVAAAEAQLAQKLDSDAALAAKQRVQQERTHLQELTETLKVLVEEEEEIYAEEMEAEVAAAKEAHAAELFEANAAVETAKLAIVSTKEEPKEEAKQEPKEEAKPQVNREYVVDSEGFVTVTIPSGVVSPRTISITFKRFHCKIRIVSLLHFN